MKAWKHRRNMRNKLSQMLKKSLVIILWRNFPSNLNIQNTQLQTYKDMDVQLNRRVQARVTINRSSLVADGHSGGTTKMHFSGGRINLQENLTNMDAFNPLELLFSVFSSTYNGKKLKCVLVIWQYRINSTSTRYGI